MADETKFCYECKRETVMFEDHSQGLICTECGLVVEENNVDTTRDIRIFEDNAGAQRVEEANASANGVIAPILIKFKGNNPESMILQRCQKMQLKSMKDDKLKSGRTQIADFASTLNISAHVKEYAERIYDQLTDSQKIAQNVCTVLRMRGKKHKALLVGCLYHASSQLDQPKSLDEFAAGTGLSKKEISHARKFIQQRTTNVNIEGNDDKKVSRVETLPVVAVNASNGAQPHDLVKAEVSRICSRLQFSFRDRKCAEEIADIARRTLDIRKAPNSQAAAIVWIFMHLALSSPLAKSLKSDFMQVISVSLGTLRQTYSLFIPHLPKILPTDQFGEPHEWEKKLQRP